MCSTSPPRAPRCRRARARRTPARRARRGAPTPSPCAAPATRLSAAVLTFSAAGSSVPKGERLQATIQTIPAMGAPAIVVRHSGAGTAHRLAHTGWPDVPVVNAGDGTHEHPTQALLDAFTLRRALAGVPASGPVTDGPRGQG